MSGISEVFNPETQSQLEIGSEVENTDNDLDAVSDISEDEESSTNSDSNYFIASKNDLLWGKRYAYEVLDFLGQGSFGTVFKCCRMDVRDGRLAYIDTVAVKVARFGNDRAAWTRHQHELNMLHAVRSAKEFCIQPLESFKIDVHKSIAFELMDVSLDSYIKETLFNNMPLAVIRRVISDVLQGLAKLKDLGIVHADIKPDNIMLTRGTYRTKLIDFGLAHFVVKQTERPIIQTLYYRAPEIILQLESGYGCPIDMWSVGCTLGEIFTYSRLFPGKCSYDVLRYMCDAQGLPKQHLITSSQMQYMYFTDQNPDRNWTLKTPEQFLAESYELDKRVIYERKSTVDLDSIHNINLPNLNDEEEQTVELSDRNQLGDLLKKMLRMDPDERISPKAALEHPFMTMTHLSQMRHLRSVQRSFELMGRDVSQAVGSLEIS